MTSQPEDWRAIAARKQEERESRIPNAWRVDTAKYSGRRNLLDVPLTCGILSEREIDITDKYDAVDIVQRIKEGQFSAEEVTVAFCKRAAIAQQLTNCLTEIFFDEAIARARELDLERSKNPHRPLGPLHGLPISLKDTFKVPGYDASIGFISLAEKPCGTYSALPALLLDLGAVLYCKTNVPQTLMTADSDNNVFGRVLNPCNTSLTAGGSTGGEGALVAMRGSVLGIGGDVAGSIRIPALCDGVYGFKPSEYMIPSAGQQSSLAPGLPGIIPSVGPIATSLRACVLFMQTVLEAEPWRNDASCLHIPWQNTPVKREGLRVGLIEDDGLYTPSPPARRGLRESVAKLRKLGVEVMPISLPNVAQDLQTTWDLYALDGCKVMLDQIKSSGEPLVASVARTGLVAMQPKTLEEFMSLNCARQTSCKAFIDMWTRNGLDLIMVPPAPHTALPLDEWTVITYTALFNFLNCPTVVIPVGHVSEVDVADNIGNAKYGLRDAEVYKLYTGPQDYLNAPISIQLVGLPQEDEKLGQVALAIESALHDLETTV